MKSRIFKLLFIAGTLAFFGGCRTLYPPNQNTPQPWAQPEPWQGAPGLPGFNGSDGSGAGY